MVKQSVSVSWVASAEDFIYRNNIKRCGNTSVTSEKQNAMGGAKRGRKLKCTIMDGHSKPLVSSIGLNLLHCLGLDNQQFKKMS
ncbi:hypothetical protein GOODEAATRI_023934 [Goodea atripinnis]|uniref:Uncharacterized protein n=1 Tax=Goodea atripinnis TaxID=208336 RepID=A0ABV0PGI8_9TELE